MIETGETTGELPKNTIVFCAKPWKAMATALTIMVLLTFFWGTYILNTYDEDYFFGEGRDLTVSEFLFRNVAATDVQRLYYSVPPAVVGITGGGVNATVLASGAIVGANGYVLTTLHTVANLAQIDVEVATPQGPKRYPAQVVKTEPTHDLVLLKMMTPERFLYFRLADTQGMAVGQPVYAFGRGARNNAVVRQGGLLAVDTPLNAGNMVITHLLRTDSVYSWEQNGGPLVNASGEMLGVNLATVGANGRIEGYSVPAHVILAHFQDVLKFKVVKGAKAPKIAAAETGPVTTGPTALPAAASWWAKARAQVAPSQSPSTALGLNVAVGPIGGLSTANAPSGHQVLVDFDHGKGLRIAGYPLSDLLGLVVLALAAGITGGMMTMGGGVLQVAGMMVFFGYGMYLIRPVAFLTNVAVYGAAALRNNKAGLIEWPKVWKLTPWGVAGVVIGYFLGNAIGDRVVGLMLGFFALLMAAKAMHEVLVLDPAEARAKAEGDGESEPAEDRAAPLTPARSALLGLPMGLVSGILGISGGVIEVPLQRYLGRIPLHNAIANSSVLVFWASVAGSAVAFAHGIKTGLIDWEAPIALSLVMIPGAYAGGILGAKLMRALPVHMLKWVYTAIMAAIAVKMLVGR